jgi:hypothetical protein
MPKNSLKKETIPTTEFIVNMKMGSAKQCTAQITEAQNHVTSNED